MQRSGYLPAVDGLRALAVLSVIAYHLNASYLPGGFVGVDIFFVISGFVVAKSVAEANPATFLSYVGWFYRRRILRIMPALLAFLMIAAIATALFVPSGAPTKMIEPTGLSAIFGLSNVVLFLKSGDYFETGSEFNPFTHTWSLAIEEQYYFLFPLFSYLLLVRRGVEPRTRSVVLSALVVAVALSLAAAAWLSHNNPSFAFYMLPTRFWELGLGFLTFYCFRNRDALGGGRENIVLALSLLAFAVLALSLWTTPATAFPFPGALLPCVSTAWLLLAFWRGRESMLGKFFAWRPFVSIGKISYSLYLWHWGVLVMMRWTVGVDTLVLQAVALALMFSLAMASYYFVEQPVRINQTIRSLRAIPLAASVAGTVGLVVAVNAALWLAKPMISQSATREHEVWDPYRAPAGLPCDVSRSEVATPAGTSFMFRPTTCAISKPPVWVFGDSHAGAYGRSFYRLASEGREVHLYTMGGCRLIPSNEDSVPGCRAFRTAALRHIASRLSPGDVFFAPGLYTPRIRDLWGSAPTPLDQTYDVDRVYAEIVSPLVATGARIVLEGPKAVSPTSPYRCADWFNRGSAYCESGFGVSRSFIEQSALPARAVLNQIKSRSGTISVWDPLPLLCGPTRCEGMQKQRPLYYDTDHLSGFGNDILYSDLRARLSG